MDSYNGEANRLCETPCLAGEELTVSERLNENEKELQGLLKTLEGISGALRDKIDGPELGEAEEDLTKEPSTLFGKVRSQKKMIIKLHSIVKDIEKNLYRL